MAITESENGTGIDEKRIRERIRKDVRLIFRGRENELSQFIPGKTKVHYGGRVYDDEEMTALVDSCIDMWLTLGPYGREFEDSFAKTIGSRSSMLINSGSSANLVATAALCSPQLGKNAIKPGDEVITPAATFPTTFNPIIQLGLKPVFVDVDGSGTYNIDASRLTKRLLSKRTRAMIIPHTLGNPNDMDVLTEFAEKHGLYLIEDACDALGSKFGGKMLGSFGEFGTFSFYAAHHITLGEGGAVVSDDEKLMNIARSIRDWGRACVCPVCKLAVDPEAQCELRFSKSSARGSLPEDYDKRYVYINIGYNLKPLDIQAAMGLAQLRKLPAFLKARERNFRFLYDEVFERYEDYFVLPKTVGLKAEPSWFAFPLTVKKNPHFARKDIVKYLEEKLIETRLLFAGNIIRQPAYARVKFRKEGPLGNTDTIMHDSFFIGVYPGIEERRLEYVKEVVDDFMKLKKCTR